MYNEETMLILWCDLSMLFSKYKRKWVNSKVIKCSVCPHPATSGLLEHSSKLSTSHSSVLIQKNTLAIKSCPNIFIFYFSDDFSEWNFSMASTENVSWVSISILCLAVVGVASNGACVAILIWKKRTSMFHRLLKASGIFDSDIFKKWTFGYLKFA